MFTTTKATLKSNGHENNKSLPYYEMKTQVQEAEPNDDLRARQLNKPLDIYNMCGNGGPSFSQVTPHDLNNSVRLYGGTIDVQDELKTTMNSPQRNYWRDKHMPYENNLSTTQPFIANQMSPKPGHNGMQLQNRQGGLMALPGNTAYRTQSTTLMEGSRTQNTLRGKSTGFATAKHMSLKGDKLNSTMVNFLSPADKHMKETFFSLPHNNQQAKKIRHLSIQRLGEDTFNKLYDHQVTKSAISPRAFGSTGGKMTKEDILQQMATIRTGGSVLSEGNYNNLPSASKIAGKVGKKGDFLDTMHNTFELGTIGGKNTKMDMWDMATIMDDHTKKQEDHARLVYKKKQQAELRDFYKTQIQFKTQMKTKEDELRDRDLRNVQFKNAKLERYDQERRDKHMKFISQLERENKDQTLQHVRHNNLSVVENNNTVQASFRNGKTMKEISESQQRDVKRDQKDLLMESNQNEIAERMIEKMKKHQESYEYEKMGLQQRERDFQNRDRRVAAHHQKIYERDNALYSTFAQPHQGTHTKWDKARTDHVHRFNQQVHLKYQDKNRKEANQWKTERQALLDETITTNKRAQIERENYHLQK